MRNLGQLDAKDRVAGPDLVTVGEVGLIDLLALFEDAVLASQISESVNNMSSQIDSTMTTVKERTEAAAKIQRQAMDEFSETSLTLNEQVTSMTNYIQRVTKEIALGLAAVSEGNRKMEHYITRFNEAFDQLGALPETVKQITTQVSALCTRIDKLLPAQQLVAERVEV